MADSEPGAAPRFLLIGGPNGSGKTKIVTPGVQLPIINADEIARTLARVDPQAAAAEARVLASQQVKDHFASRTSFGIETTLNKDTDLALVRRAKTLGYDTEALLIWSGGLEVSLERVRLRVAQGGHNVPLDEVRSRYQAGVEALPVIVGAIDLVTVFDNSRPEVDGPEVVLEAENGVIVALVDRPPTWLASGFARWKAPMELDANLTALAADPRAYFAQQLIEAKRRGK